MLNGFASRRGTGAIGCTGLRRDSARWDQQLAFRNALRSDSALAERYAELKRDLAARHGDDREAYTDAKRAFVQTVINNRKDGFGVGE